MEKVVFVSFYTAKTPYEELAKSILIPSLERANLPYEVDSIDTKGSWKFNTDYKPIFLKEKLQKYDTIVWLDCDAEVKRNPDLLFNIPPEFNIALHILDWNKQYKYTNNMKEVLSGTLLLRKGAMDIVDKWIKKSSEYNWEQKALEKILKDTKYPYYELPAEYCTVITKDGGIPDYIKEPVIIHYQASRRYRRLV
jgi:lipopolysaccharide biosynthesis glycosyltransferase